MKTENNKIVVGTPVCGVLCLVFFILKMTGTIDWSWWWVFAPLWIPATLIAVVIIVTLFILGVIAMINLRQ